MPRILRMQVPTTSLARRPRMLPAPRTKCYAWYLTTLGLQDPGQDPDSQVSSCLHQEDACQPASSSATERPRKTEDPPDAGCEPASSPAPRALRGSSGDMVPANEPSFNLVYPYNRVYVRAPEML